jgi:hypothetical protein
MAAKFLLLQSLHGRRRGEGAGEVEIEDIRAWPHERCATSSALIYKGITVRINYVVLT